MSVSDLDLHQLMVFYNVATEQSISIAADKLCLTQPTVSYHLKSLEKSAGVKLFNIKKQRVYLTEAGQDLYRLTKGIWEQLSNVDRYLNSLKQKLIKIGITPLLLMQVTTALSRICKSYPEVNIEMVITNTTNIIQGVADMEIDIGIVVSTDYGNLPVRPVRISDAEKLVFVASPNLPIAQKERVDWHDLQDMPIICGQPGSLLHTLVIEKFRDAGIPASPHIMVNTLSMDVLKVFVKEGHAIGFWHIKEAEKEVLGRELKILPFVEDITVPIDAISNENNEFEKPILKDLLEFIIQELDTPSALGL